MTRMMARGRPSGFLMICFYPDLAREQAHVRGSSGLIDRFNQTFFAFELIELSFEQPHERAAGILPAGQTRSSSQMLAWMFTPHETRDRTGRVRLRRTLINLMIHENPNASFRGAFDSRKPNPSNRRLRTNARHGERSGFDRVSPYRDFGGGFATIRGLTN